MEKRRPHYDLDTIKATFATVRSLRMTRTARDCAFSLGLMLEGVVDMIQGMSREHFYKSMTSLSSSALWQDVYHVPWQETVLYVKFTTDDEGFLVISLKER
ncbi:MAG: type II toxin-antitoxin system MqsR family toxin [Polyangia bacterium]|nr:type II toxin-antitoxin system MqsR family toxin [Polyangia bacterium]